MSFKNYYNICLIGGSGFLGSSLRTLFSRLGHKVYIIGRSNYIDLQINEHYFSLSTISFAEIIEFFEAIHLDFIFDLTHSNVPNLNENGIASEVSKNLNNLFFHLEFTKELQADKFIYFSSGGTVYGEIENQQPISENQINFPLSDYGISKLCCEKYVYSYCKKNNLRFTIIRPSNVYGPNQLPFRGQGLIATALGSAIKNQSVNIFGDGNNIRDYIFVDDFCLAILDIINFSKVDEIYNVGSGVGVSINELIEIINHVIQYDNCKVNVKYLPERPSDVKYNVLNVTKLKSLNNWAPKFSLESGITESWKWIKNYCRINP